MATDPKIAGATARAAGAEILAERAKAEGEQVELFAIPVADPKGELATARDMQARGPGRPEGASNKATVAMRDYLLRRGVLPQAAVMQWVQLGPSGLALALWRETGASGKPPPDFMMEGAKLWSKMTADLGRYFMAPMAPADGAGQSVPFLAFQFMGNGPADAAGKPLAPWVVEAMANQPLTENGDGESQSQESKE
jgi:hypothetical protein